MPYYVAGDYYGRGDYYRAGDFLGIGKALKKVAGTVTGVVSKLGIPGVSGVAGLAHGLIAGGRVAPPSLTSVPFPGGLGVVPGPVGGVSNVPSFTLTGPRRGRRMNVTNVKALRRAGRRVRGFLKLARRFGAMPVSPKGKKLFKARRRR